MDLQTSHEHAPQTERGINAILNKTDFERITSDLSDDQKWHYRDLEKFRALRAFMSEEENEFANEIVQGKAEQFRLAVHKLIEFSAQHFFVCNRHFQAAGGEFLYRLYPRLLEKIADGDERAQELWDRHVATLGVICESLRRSYREFQNATKSLINS